MKPMTKILIFLAVLIFSAVMGSASVIADNEIVLDDWKIDSSSEYIGYLLLEIDFTQGDSALVDIDVDSVVFHPTRPMSVYFLQEIGGKKYIQERGEVTLFRNANPAYTAKGVYNYEKRFTMMPDAWNRGTYCFWIYAYNFEDIYVDVNFSVLIDYDGDGLYGDKDINPTTNDNWLSELEDRLRGIDTNISLNYEWAMENITSLSSSLIDNVRVIYSSLDALQLDLEERMDGIESDVVLKYQWVIENITALSSGLDVLQSDLDEFKSSIQDEVWNQAIDLSKLRDAMVDNVTGLRESIMVLQLLLSTLEVQVYEVCDSMNETTMSMGLELEAEIAALSEALNTTDGWLQEVEDGFQSDLENVSAEIDLLESGATTSSIRLNNVDADLSVLHGETYSLEKELNELDDREEENNDARLLEAQKTQEDIEDALAEAKAARTVGLVTGLVGIILAIVAIVMTVRSKK